MMNLFASAVPTADGVSFGSAVNDCVTVINSLLQLITDNWLLLMLLLTPFVIGLVIALVRSLRG